MTSVNTVNLSKLRGDLSSLRGPECELDFSRKYLVIMGKKSRNIHCDKTCWNPKATKLGLQKPLGIRCVWIGKWSVGDWELRVHA